MAKISDKDKAEQVMVRTQFAKRLAALRESMPKMPDMGQFAKFLEIEGERYRRYERGETEPPLYILRRIKMKTGCSLDDLLVEEQKMPEATPRPQLAFDRTQSD